MNKGYTLVEVIVATAIMAVLFTAVFLLFQPVSRLVASLKTDGTMILINNSVSSYITNSLNDANYSKIYTKADLTNVNEALAADIAEYKTSYTSAKDSPRLLYFMFNAAANTYYVYTLDLKTELNEGVSTESWTKSQWETWLKVETNWGKYFTDTVENYRLFNHEFYSGNKISFEFERLANNVTDRYFINYKVNIFECEEGNILGDCPDITADDTDKFITYSLSNGFELINGRMSQAPDGTGKDIAIIYNVHDFSR